MGDGGTRGVSGSEADALLALDDVPAAAPVDPAEAGESAAVPPAPTPHGVARVVIDTPHAHLDRPFEYAITAEQAPELNPGVRVKVRFAGRDVDGYVLDVVDTPEFDGRLAPVRRVVSPEPVLTPALARLARTVADHYAGTLADVLRLAIPPRHARAEKALDDAGAHPPVAPEGDVTDDSWSSYPAGAALLRRIREGQAPAAAWSALPAQPPARDWPRALAQAAAAALAVGRGVVIVAPDHRDVERIDAALTAELGRGRHVRLAADQGPQARYTAWLRVLRGQVRCVVGTRAAAYAPVRNPGLLAWWDDGDDLHEEPRAPYPHTGEVLRIRAEQEGAALLAGGFARSTTVQWWVDQGVLVPVEADRAIVRAAMPRILIGGEGSDAERDTSGGRGRIPPSAMTALRQGLLGDGAGPGPVLVQVPRGGYRPALACVRCHTPARCSRCGGPVAQDSPTAEPVCAWCHHPAGTGGCEECGGALARGRVIGSRRTAEELGRAFPGVPVLTSGGEHVVGEVGTRPALVVATPGAEPVAEDGYAAVVLVDGGLLLRRPGLRSGEEAVRRWMTAAALARSGRDGGVVVLAGVPSGDGVTVPAVESLVRWAPAWFAARELAERASLGLPPVRDLAEFVGDTAVVEELAERPPPGLTALGPIPVSTAGGVGDAQGAPSRSRLVWTPTESGATARRVLVDAVRHVRASRSVRREDGDLRVRVGVLDVG